jgi:hypothetical protein
MRVNKMKLLKYSIVLAFVLALPMQSLAVNIQTNPKFIATDDSGTPLADGCLYSYDCGTTDKSATCADYTCSADNSNPVTLDSRGEADIYIDQCIKFALYEADQDGTCDTDPSTPLIWVKDRIKPEISTASDGSVIIDPGTDGTDATFTGDVLSSDGTTILVHGTDGTDAVLTGDVVSTDIIFDDFDLITKAGGDFTGITYSSLSKDVSAQETIPQDVFFKTDGLSMYVLGASLTDTVYQYTLSTAWDVSTAAYASKSKVVSAEETSPISVFFKSDGLVMFVVGFDSETVFQYTLSTAWDVSTASYASKSKDISAEDGFPVGLFFSSAGEEMYIAGASSNTVYQYTLSTAWDVSTATYASKSKDVSSEDTGLNECFFSQTGLDMFIIGAVNDNVYRYTLSTAWDVSTAAYSSESISVAAEDTGPTGLFYRANEIGMYLSGSNTSTIYQYLIGSIGVYVSAF